MSGTLRRPPATAVEVSDGTVRVVMSAAVDLAGAAPLWEACELATGMVRLHLVGPAESAGFYLCRVVKEAEARAKANRCRLLISAADPAIAGLLSAAGIVVDPAPSGSRPT